MRRRLLALISLVVPGTRRDEWRREWNGECQHRDEELRMRGATQGVCRRDSRRRLIAALSHAVWLRRLEWGFVRDDFRFAVRGLGRRPALAAVIVGTLALGIGGATTMFSVVNAVLLRPLPYDQPDQLVWMFGDFSGYDSAAVSPPDFVDYRARNQVFDSLGAMAIAPSGTTVAGPDGPRRLQAVQVTAGLVSTLGVRPSVGRDFETTEESISGPSAVIISHRVWRDQFDLSPTVLGRSIVVDDRAHTIVGVMPAGFALPFDPFITLLDPVDLYLPLKLDAPGALVRRFHYLRLIGRLRDDTSLTQAQTDMDVIARQLENTYPENETWRLRLLPLQERLVGESRPALLMLFAAVGLVLLIACGNVAGLLLTQATRRQGEVVLRSALGASRSRIVRQLLAEGSVLALTGAGAGLLIASLCLGMLRRAGPDTMPRLAEATIDPLAIVFAAVTAIVATMLFSLAPALHVSKPASGAAGPTDKRTTSSRTRTRSRHVLITAQVGVSVMLLLGAGLLARSFVRLQAVDLGFNSAGVTIAPLSLPDGTYEDPGKAERFFSSLVTQLEVTGATEAVGLTTTPPLAGSNDTAVHVAGAPPATPADRRFAQVRWVQGRYFDVFRIPVLFGRAFDDARDTPASSAVVIISQAMADAFFRGQNPVGKRVVVDLAAPLTAEVVGIVGDTRVFGQAEAPPPLIYLSARQTPATSMTIVARLASGRPPFAGVLREAVGQLDPSLAVDRIQRMEDLVDGTVAPARFRLAVIGAFAATALLLTVVGLYGLLAQMVADRRREIGIRMALGARAQDVARLVVRQGSLLVGVGLILGAGGAMAAGRWLSSMLFETTHTDPLVFVSVAGLVGVITLAAVAIPARRAARVDAATALRAD